MIFQIEKDTFIDIERIDVLRKTKNGGELTIGQSSFSFNHQTYSLILSYMKNSNKLKTELAY